jgi:hypothetical protein
MSIEPLPSRRGVVTLSAAEAAIPVGERVRQLQAEARALAGDHQRALVAHAEATIALAQEILDGGDAYLPGARMVARDIIRDLEGRLQSLQAITARNP